MNTIQIRYFAAAAEAAGCEQEQREAPATLAALRSELAEAYGPDMAKVLAAGSFLVNGVVRRDDGELPESAAVDVLPPFAGG